VNTRRTTEFETTPNDDSTRVSAARRSAFGAVSDRQPDGVRRAHRRVPGARDGRVSPPRHSGQDRQLPFDL
jgi:hypothetical protein